MSTQSQKYQREAIDRALASLPPNAPVRAIVASKDVQDKLTAFEAADSRAKAEQDRYKLWGRRGIGATTFGVVLGALVLLPVDTWLEGAPKVVIGALQTLALAVTFGATLLITWLRPLHEWMSSRAEAERLRGKVFDAIVNGKAPPGADARVLLGQKLDLLMAAHVDDQLGYFKKRSREHRKLASKFSPLRLLGYLLIVCATLLGAAALASELGVRLPGVLKDLVDHLVLRDANRWQLGLATIASGILAHATAQTLMDQDERKAVLYDITAKKLRKLIDRDLANVRDAVAKGEESALERFFADVRSIMEQEHAVWSFVRPSDED
jgi:hypothetical protein